MVRGVSEGDSGRGLQWGVVVVVVGDVSEGESGRGCE